MSQPYDLHIAALAMAVVAVATLAALNLVTRVVGVRGFARVLLLAPAPAILGTGIWVGALLGVYARDPHPLPELSLGLVLLTWPLAMLMAACGLLAPVRPHTRLHATLLGGLLAGVGLALMHALIFVAVRRVVPVAFDLYALCVLALAAGAAGAAFTGMMRGIVRLHGYWYWQAAARFVLAILIAVSVGAVHLALVATQPGVMQAPPLPAAGAGVQTLALMMAGALTLVTGAIQIVATVYSEAERRAQGALTELRTGMARLSREVRQRRSAQQELATVNAALGERAAAEARFMRDADALERFGTHLQHCLTDSEVMAVLRANLRDLLPGSSGLLLSAGETVGWKTMLRWGEPFSLPAFDPADCRAARAAEPHWTGPQQHAQRCRHLPGLPAERLSACLPLAGTGARPGLLCVDYAAEPAHLPARTRRLLTGIADRLALALVNVQLRQDAVSDPLTGLYNRRPFQDALAREIARGQRDGTHLALILFDVDEFKAYNDHHGHGAGDRVLSAIAAVLRAQVRAGDVVCRYGGEEFVVLMPDSRVHEAVTRAREICAAVRDMYTADPRLRRRITMSAGVAGCPDHGADPAGLVRAADLALYAAKSAGRDRVLVAGAHGPIPPRSARA